MGKLIPPTVKELIARFEELGHVVFTNGDWNPNLFGIRNREKKAGRFDDILGCFCKQDGEWILQWGPGTTDPSAYWLERLGNPQGTFILKPGQYRGIWQYGLHRGKYPALIQTGGPVTGWRDRNRDDILDMIGPLFTGYFGINRHKSSAWQRLVRVGPYSAGCQVDQDPGCYEQHMVIVRKSLDRFGLHSKHSYVLLEEWR